MEEKTMKTQNINSWARSCGMNVLINYRWPVLLLIVAIMFTGYAGMTKIRVDTSNESKFSSTDDVNQRNKKFEAIFGNEDFVFLLIEAEDVFDHNVLAYIRELSGDLEANLPFLESVTALTSVEYIDVIDGDLYVDDLIGDDGDDLLDGGAGTDFVDGGQGFDVLHGGGGTGDTLIGGPDGDVIHGSDDGSDLIQAGPGVDTVFGGGGNDQINGMENGATGENLWGDGGNDEFQFWADGSGGTIGTYDTIHDFDMDGDDFLSFHVYNETYAQANYAVLAYNDGSTAGSMVWVYDQPAAGGTAWIAFQVVLANVNPWEVGPDDLVFY
jgi:Ca2+-binding RTX toxin-like protein